MLLNVLLVVGLLSACLTINAVHVDSGCKTPTTFNQLSLCQEFQMIRDLAPHDSVIRLVQSHMQNDIRFRKAIQYILSPEFKKTTAKIDTTATYQNVLRYFVRAGINTEDIDSVGKIFDCIVVPILEEATSEYRSSLHPEQIAESRSLSTFVQEVSRLIPSDELINTLETRVAKNKQFAEFYEVLRNPTFRTKVMQGFTSRDISRPIKTLRRYQINLSQLVEYTFNLFYLGPEVDN